MQKTKRELAEEILAAIILVAFFGGVLVAMFRIYPRHTLERWAVP